MRGAPEAALAPPRELWQGSGGAAPSGVQGRSPGGGLGGRSPPENFEKIEVIWCNFSNTERHKTVKYCYHNSTEFHHILAISLLIVIVINNKFEGRDPE